MPDAHCYTSFAWGTVGTDPTRANQAFLGSGVEGKTHIWNCIQSPQRKSRPLQDVMNISLGLAQPPLGKTPFWGFRVGGILVDIGPLAGQLNAPGREEALLGFRHSHCVSLPHRQLWGGRDGGHEASVLLPLLGPTNRNISRSQKSMSTQTCHHWLLCRKLTA